MQDEFVSRRREAAEEMMNDALAGRWAAFSLRCFGLNLSVDSSIADRAKDFPAKSRYIDDVHLVSHLHKYSGEK